LMVLWIWRVLGVGVFRFDASVSAPAVEFRKSRNASIGGHTILQDGDYFGRLDFKGSDGVGWIFGAQISASVDGTPGTNDMPGKLEFRTTPDGSTALATRLTIGNVGAFTTNPAAGGHAVFNEGGVDADFRVESDGNANMLFVDGGNNRVGIATSSPGSALQVGDATYNDGTITVVDSIGFNSASNLNPALNRWALRARAGGVEGHFDIYNARNTIAAMTFGDSEVVANEDSGNVDFRVESNNNTHMLFVDGGTNRIGMNDSAPASTLSIISDEAQLIISGSVGGNARGLKVSTETTGFQSNDTVILDAQNAASGKFKLKTQGVERLSLTGTETVFNDTSTDTDFRVESDGYSHMLFVDASNNGVGIGDGTTLANGLRISSSTGTTNAVNTKLYINADCSGTTTTGFGPGITFAGVRNGDGVLQQMAQINVVAEVNSGTTLSSGFQFMTATAGANTEKLRIQHDGGFVVTPAAGGHAVFNEDGVDADFRVESDGSSHALFVEGDGTGVGINTSDPQEALHVTGSVRLDGNNNGITSGEAVNQLIFKDTDTTTGGGQTMGQIDFVTADADAPGVSARISGVADSSTTGQGRLTLFTGAEGTLSNNITMAAGSVVINEVGADMDFRVESDTNANMFVVDASTDRVGVGVAAPLQTLHVAGSVFSSSGYYITVLQGNAQLTNASTSSGSNASYIGQGLITVVVSDAKAKENFGAVEENECLNKIVSLADHVKKFDWIDEDWKREKGRTVGMVAQEVYEDHSEFVHKPENYNDDGWAIRYQEIVPTLIKAFQEQQELIKTLESRITALES
jgi:hypothetical protein